jgi:hypothetical protein
MCVKSCCHTNNRETEKLRGTCYNILLYFETHDFISAAPLECEPTLHSLLMAGMCFSARQRKKKKEEDNDGVYLKLSTLLITTSLQLFCLFQFGINSERNSG